MIQERERSDMKEELHGDEHCILQYFFHLVRHKMFFLLFLLPLEFGEAGISQAGLALVVRSARPCWVFGTAFHGPPLLGMAAGLAGGCGTANL